MTQTKEHIYFIGIGGISMSGLAEILASRGHQVSGTDVKETAVTKHLQSLGIHINFGHRAENITDDITLVVYTAAIHDDNPELRAAHEKGIRIMDRAHLLGQIMDEYHDSVAVSGTHGKTTTTSMVSEILLAAEKDPTITVGGILPTIGSNLRIGNSPYFVAEACEYFDSFLQFNPFIAIILNVESDHLDYFKTLENIRRSFHAFAQRVPDKGLLVISEKIDHVEELTDGLTCHVETFGLSEKANWRAENIVHEADGRNSFDIYHNSAFFTTIHLHIPGEHNITNALAAIAASAFLGAAPEDCVKGLHHYTGTERRFQLKGKRTASLSSTTMPTIPQKSKQPLRQHRMCSTTPHGVCSSLILSPVPVSSLMNLGKLSATRMKSSLRTFSLPEKQTTALSVQHSWQTALPRLANLPVM